MKNIRLKLSAYIVSIICIATTAGAFEFTLPKVATYVTTMSGSTGFGREQSNITQKFVYTKIMYGLTQDSLVAKNVKDNEPLMGLANKLDSEYIRKTIAGVMSQTKIPKKHNEDVLYAHTGKQSPCV